MRFESITPAWMRRAGLLAMLVSLFGFGRPVFAFEQVPPPTVAAPAQPPSPPPVGVSQPQGTAPQTAPATTVLRITADEAVKMALEYNLGIQTERLNPQLRALAVAGARSAYTPTVFSTFAQSSDTRPPSDFLSLGGVAITTSANMNGAGGVNQLLPWGGGGVQAQLSGLRATSNAPRTVFSPQLGSTFSLQYTQPLLRNFLTDTNRQVILQSRKQLELADVQLAERITLTSRTVRNAYLSLIAAINGLRVSQQSLELARQSVRDNQKRVEVGAMAQIDMVEAEAQVAAQEEDVILAEAQIQTAEDFLRTLIMNQAQPEYWTTKVEPSEQPVLTPFTIDIDGALKNALANRTDLLQINKQLDLTDLSIKYNENQRLPDVNLTARYGMTGIGGTQFRYGPPPEDGSAPDVVGSSQRSFSNVLGDVFGNDFRNWSVALNVSYPVGRSSAEASLASSRLERRQGLMTRQELELQITAQVRDAARQVTTALKRVEATRKARELAGQQLAAQERRLAVGLIDTFRMLQAQRDLSAQLVAELNAIIAYNRALIDFEAVQTVPVQ